MLPETLSVLPSFRQHVSADVGFSGVRMTGLHTASENLVSADSLLSRLDPRLKLLLLLLLVLTIFSVSGFSALLCVGGLAAGLLIWQPLMLKHFWRRLLYLRWLLLFTFSLHLFLTPGRTLFGLRILSYDGLLRGIMVDLQLVLALFFTLCFALITKPEAVAWGVTRLLGPLQRLGLPVSEIGGLLILVLHFLPQVFQQGMPLFQKDKQQKRQSVAAILQQLSRSVGALIIVLVEQADGLAQDIWRGENPLRHSPAEFCWSRRDSVCLTLGLFFIALCWCL